MIVMITPNYQVHLPVNIRKKVGLKRHGRARVTAQDKKIIIEPLGEESGFLSLAGSIKTKKTIPLEKIRDHIDYSDL